MLKVVSQGVLCKNLILSNHFDKAYALVTLFVNRITLNSKEITVAIAIMEDRALTIIVSSNVINQNIF